MGDGVQLSGLLQRLVQANLLDEKTAVQAQAQAQRNKLSLVTHLVQNKLVSGLALAELSAGQPGIAYCDPNSLDKGSFPRGAIGKKLVCQHRVIPLWRRGSKLFVGIFNPTNHQAINNVQFSTGLTTEAILVEDDKLDLAIGKLFESAADDLTGLDNIDLEGLDIGSADKSTRESTSAEADDAPVVRFVNKMLLDVIKGGSSDLHFEPYEEIYRVRFRADSTLHKVAKPPIQSVDHISARLKVMAGLDISERRKPQGGRIKMRVSRTKSINFRVSTLPTPWGKKIVMWILDSSSAQMDIDAPGYEEDQKELYLAALKQPQGMILVTDPASSGKTVSLYTGLNILNTTNINISTAEDPVEINLEGTDQVNVDPRQGMDFSQALRAFLCQDPDVVMVGEIRDLETAEIIIKAAQTGHIVMSTLCTNSAAETLTRLLNMGVPAFSPATSMSLIIVQRLTRKLCSHCKKEHEVSRETLLHESFPEDKIGTFKLYSPAGCDHCKNGYKGRVGIYEVVKSTPALQRIIMEEGNSTEIAEQARKKGFDDLCTSGLLKTMQGITSLEEVNRVTED